MKGTKGGRPRVVYTPPTPEQQRLMEAQEVADQKIRRALVNLRGAAPFEDVERALFLVEQAQKELVLAKRSLIIAAETRMKAYATS